ncbi:bifunctional 3,4-dihydroxy-2-butanone-4-phosphate synthase/GTP cyclohydrolase II [uncultured Sunxiuqinia sp.]|uniref:bifunctional 3,4-dihydroxy-2-butanone-4-phosphate synthase/GTP cyclohydrolase II n=1 Tax=uncultured Sunxiuqinia sp. TaxID=1573825 RepID=UPI002AA70F1E|nr:bifunctional 3,4-dihydroxy-2-butanone-4-phosphate synthase/GTP cyclohydrolase II [uncultured Sunxiuqinia sp.]
MDEFKLNTVPEAIDAIRKGDLIIVVDDEDRENEGDFIAAAELMTPEKVNFMATHGRGLICAPLTESRCEELNLELMVGKNTSSHQTPFTVSVDLIGYGCTTGISASDRAKTILALTDDDIDPEELGRPGHIFPLKAKDRGVLRRAGHTEAAIDLARLAGLKSAGVLVEIMNEDGTMARLPELMEVADKFDLKIISIKDLIAYLLKSESLVDQGEEVQMPTKYGDFRIIPFRQKSNGAEHVALIKGSWEEKEEILVRMHSSCMTGDIFGSMRCECGEQLHKSMEMIEKAGKGVVVYMMQEGRGIGLMNKIAAYKLQDEGMDTIDANIHLGFQADERDYGVGAQILRKVGVCKMKLLTNNPVKRVGIEGYGLEVTETIPVEVEPNKYNQQYLKTKRDRMGHFLQKFKYD